MRTVRPLIIGVLTSSLILLGPTATASDSTTTPRSHAQTREHARALAKDFSYATATGEQIEILLAEYLVVDGENFHFDTRRAREDGATPDLLEFGSLLSTQPRQQHTPSSPFTTAGTTASAASLRLPAIYGRWCGPLASGPRAPVDLLDEQCMKHDRCYAANGWGNHACDATFIENLRRTSPHMTRRQQVVAYGFGVAITAKLRWTNPVPDPRP